MYETGTLTVGRNRAPEGGVLLIFSSPSGVERCQLKLCEEAEVYPWSFVAYDDLTLGSIKEILQDAGVTYTDHPHRISTIVGTDELPQRVIARVILSLN